MKRTKTVPVVLQHEIAECGLACIAMIAGYHGLRIDLQALRSQFDPGLRGAKLKELADLGESLGFKARTLKLGPNQIDRLKLPAIVHWNLVHYVVLVGRTRDGFEIVDPGFGRKIVDEADFSRSFTGIAQEFEPTTALKQGSALTKLPYGWLIDNWGAYGSFVGAVFLLTLVMQLFALSVPFMAQLTIDKLSLGGDELALASALCITLLGVGMYASLHWMRGILTIHLNRMLDAEGSEKLIARLLRLPYSFFARRDMGSLLSRFANLREVRTLLTQGLAESCVEALLAVGTLIITTVYLPSAALVAVAGVLAYSTVRIACQVRLRERVGEAFLLQSGQHASLIETLHKIQTIKANSLEVKRQRFWSWRYTDYQSSLTRRLRTEAVLHIAQFLVFAVGYAVTAWMALRAMFSGRLSSGEVLTVLILVGIFFARFSQFLDRFFDFLVARVHLDGLADIALAEPESGISSVREHETAREIELRNVGFRHTEKDPYVFKNVNLRVKAGSFLAITGPSGSGKSTLLSLLLGLRSPTEGEILIDGLPIGARNICELRKRIGSVLQADNIFYGNVIENITLFELDPPIERVWQVIEAVQLKDVVEKLPIGEYTVLSDVPMLSGGEIQRLLLARALYKQPDLLVLDEASAHLDEETERRVNRHLSALGSTRIVVAHRRQTYELADTVVRLGPDAGLGCSTILSTECKNEADSKPQLHHLAVPHTSTAEV